MTIGDTVYVFDVNRRVYPKDASLGRSPIYREHFRPIRIASETRVSWVLDDGRRVNKKTLGGIFSPAQIDDACYVQANRYEIIRTIERCRDAALLRQIAALIGWNQ